MKPLTLIALGLIALAVGCGGSSDDDTPAPVDHKATAAVLTRAQGDIYGTCIAAETLGIDATYKQRKEMRDNLQLITEQAEADPLAVNKDGQTQDEVLYDLIPELKKCDAGLATEAQASVTRIFG